MTHQHRDQSILARHTAGPMELRMRTARTYEGDHDRPTVWWEIAMYDGGDGAIPDRPLHVEYSHAGPRIIPLPDSSGPALVAASVMLPDLSEMLDAHAGDGRILIHPGRGSDLLWDRGEFYAVDSITGERVADTGEFDAVLDRIPR